MNFLSVRLITPDLLEESWRELEREREQQRRIQEARDARRAERPSRLRPSRRSCAAHCGPTHSSPIRALQSPKPARPHVATKIGSMSASHASLTDIPTADVPHTDAKWTPVRNHFG